MTRPVVFTGDIFRVQPHGGITRYFLEVARRLRRPHRVLAVLHVSTALARAGVTAEAAFRMPELPGAPRLRRLVNWVVDGVLLRPGSAIVHPTYYRDLAGLPRGSPLVATVYDMTHERFPELFRRHWWNAADPARHKAQLCRRADRIVCISEVTRQDLVERLGIPPERTRVIHCGAPDWSNVEARSISGIQPPFLLWVGERHTYKNFDATLQALVSCRDARDVGLLCAGGPPLDAGERARLATLDLGGRVRQQPLVESELRWAYEHAAGLLYTSRWEGFGLPVIEAMSLGTPVVVSNGGAIPEVAGSAAIYVDPTDLASIREGIARCLSEDREPAGVRARMAQAARFRWQDAADAHEALYGELD